MAEAGTHCQIRPKPDVVLKSGYKFTMCRNVSQGVWVCARGEKCPYAHSTEELRQWNSQVYQGMLM